MKTLAPEIGGFLALTRYPPLALREWDLDRKELFERSSHTYEASLVYEYINN